MDSQSSAQPHPEAKEPEFDLFPSFDNLCLESRSYSFTETNLEDKSIKDQKSRAIAKLFPKVLESKKKQNAHVRSKGHSTRKKINHLQNRIKQLEKELSSLKRRYECCPGCHLNISNYHEMEDAVTPNSHQINNLTAQLEQRRNSKDSVQFQKIDFIQSLADRSEMEEKAWVLLGTMMIVMGSKNLDVDGTINTFKILKDSVDALRRQVEKCESKINLDFFCIKQEMNEAGGTAIEGLDFDPFYQKSDKTGFQLEGIKLESCDQFSLIYDQKFNFSASYQALLTAVEYLKEHSWVSHC